jgi:hypothetical protein
MALGDSYRDDLLTAIADRAATPAAPSVPKFSAWSAIPRGIGEAGAQVGATAADIAASFRYMRDATPEQRKQIDRQGVPIEQFSSAAGDSMRDAGKTLRPDPLTASTAETVLYGFARGAAKVVTGAVVGGVPGVLAAGLEEGITQSDELRRQGVDLRTRSNVGLVQGAGLALAALPAAGSTLKATAALYLAGGPGGFVAQQALTREILRNAGQDKLAEQYDPFDPVGLAVSALIPAPFAFYGLRASKRAAAAKAAEDFRAGPVPSEQTPVAGAVRDAYTPETVDAAMVLHMGERQQHADSVASTIGRPVESLATFVQREGFKEPPREPAPGPDTFLAWIKANGGLDIGEKFDITGDANGIRNNPAGIFRRGGITSDDLASRAAAEGYLPTDQAGDTGAFVDLVKRAVSGDRVLTFERQMEKAAKDYADAQNAVRLADLEQRLRLLGEDPAGARGNPDAIAAYLDRNEPRLLSAAMDEMMAAQRAADGLPEFDHLRDRARMVLQDMQDGDRTLAQYEADFGALSPVMRRAVESAQKETDATTTPQAPSPEAAAPARGAGDAPAPAAVPEPGRAGADVQAAGLTPGAKAEAVAAQARMADVQAAHPDLQVMLDGMDKPMPLADFLAAVKAEADEMEADAPLMQVAAQCALLNGS